MNYLTPVMTFETNGSPV